MRRPLLILLILAIVGLGVWYALKNKTVQDGIPNSSDFTRFFPVGNRIQDPESGSVSDQPALLDESPDSAVPDKFKPVSPHAIAGYTTFKRTQVITTPSEDPKKPPVKETIVERVIRYVARESGYVYEIVGDQTPLQISNIYIPNVYEANFTDDNKTVLLRFLRNDGVTLATYSVPIPEPNPDLSRTQKAGTYLFDNISSIAVSPDTKQVLTLTQQSGAGVLTTINSIGSSQKEVLRNSFGEWLLFWPKDAYVQTKAAASVPGFLYSIDQSRKRLVHVIGNINGLTTSVSPSGARILYSESGNNSFVTKLSTRGSIRTLSVKVLPEKCAWLKNEDMFCAGNEALPPGNYPDAWYQGLMSFSDKIYNIRSSTGVIDTLQEEDPRAFDMTHLMVNEEDTALYFIDKKTGFLWQFDY